MSDTNPDPYEFYGYMTVIDNRNPVVKMHKTLGHALNAVAIRIYDSQRVRGGQVWRYDKDRDLWVMLHEIAPNTPVDALPWRKDG